MTYTLRITETQAATISHACEVLARLGMGQYKDALECLPLKEFAPDGWTQRCPECLEAEAVQKVDT